MTRCDEAPIEGCEMSAREMRLEMFRMVSATAAMAVGASLAVGSIIIALAAFLQ
jgi:hypothetical protein